MKKILFLLMLGITITACDYLDIVPDDTATLADAFKDEDKAEGFLFTCYSYQNDYWNYRNIGMATTNEMVAAYHWGAQWFPFVQFNHGEANSSDPKFDFWAQYYEGIRQCYTFLENIDVVKPIAMSESVYAEKKRTWIGEAHFLIAYYHHQLLQHFGPIVIMDGVSMEFLPRLPFDECVDRITALYDEAIKNLTPRTESADYGRASQVVAKAMKAKLLLYAASPLFNGNTDYANFKGTDGEQLINQQYDREKWKRAMTAIKEAIDFAEGQGHRLFTYDDSADPTTIRDGQPVAYPRTPFRQAYLNTRYMIVRSATSPEIIWAWTGDPSDSYAATGGNGWQRSAAVRGLDTRDVREANPVGALATTLTAVKLFHTENGLPPEEDPGLGYSWTEEERMAIPAGDSICNLHLHREPRFYAAIGYDNGLYEFNGGREYTLKMKFGEKNGCYDKGTDHLYSTYSVKKTIHPNGKMEAGGSGWSVTRFPYPLMRLADLYLEYAEASAEYQGSLDAYATGYLSKVRERAGLTMNYFTDKSGQALVDAIRRERMIELIFESQWHYDLRRWKIAEEWFAADAGGMWGLNDEGTADETFYRETQLTAKYCKFTFKDYLLPIRNSFVNANVKLVQNPGY
jgi:hypothetical protein